MPKRQPRDSQEAGWEFLASELKRRRLAAGLTQEEVGLRAFASGSYITHFEKMGRKPSPEMAAQLDVALETDGFFERLCRKLLEKSPFAAYFAKAAELEKLATKICDFESMTVPGLLQTAAYARALTIAHHPLAEDEIIEDLVSSRIERARLITDTPRPEYWAIVHECALHVPVGGQAAMAEQLEHIADLMRARKVLLQVIPLQAGAHSIMGKSLRLMEFDDAPPTAYTEGAYSGNLLDEPAMVKQTQGAYDRLRAAALSPEASLLLIETAAEEHRRCATTT
ncbi:helix-turn-helix domain-containing protein [Streptomyces chattanoogensis]|uniref:XRE family transcriptional regulator n=1 Tax=Streptomyces chattanoogensis TaxID=66876 RepID=A0A0N0XQK2_9ACTN|nr:helix-turn-helix transcriptional regulator [Streptomyces chattanoogensis]KPC58877.1 XRE family transcriptional regulator [Streptomyces chattanoogensis]